jgi:hypothetical protein
MRRLLLIAMNLFILSCVFDPADTVLGLKVPLFCLSWFIFILYNWNLPNATLPRVLVLYVFAFIFLPILSISYYYISNGSQPYEGFSLFKAHLLISFAMLLYLAKINLLAALSRILTILAVTIILVYIIVLVFPLSFVPLYSFGLDSGIFHIGEREYAANFKIWSIYFVTSPMLAVSIAYYMHKFIESDRKIFYLILVSINVFGMFIAGTKNNMVTAILLPITLLVVESRYKKIISVFAFLFVLSFVIYFSDTILSILDPTESSNKTKLGLLDDYAKIFSDPINLLFGQGLGSFSYWPSRNNSFNFITEHTYLEIIRNFGIFMGGLLFLLILYPVFVGFLSKEPFKERYLITAYTFYLVMSATNPLFFSSLGMLILSVIIANIFIERFKNSELQIQATN